MASDHLDPAHLFGHVQDSIHFEIPHKLDFFGESDGKLEIPQPIKLQEPLFAGKGVIEPLDFKLTKFMVLELVAALLIAAIFIPLAAKARRQDRPRGKLWNLFEAMLVFIRDQVARPAIAHDPHHNHEADKFLPFLWTIFFFVLVCNLLGLLPWMGSATGALATTGALALITFLVVIGAGMFNRGPIGFWIGQVPHMDLPGPIAILLKPMVFAIEILGLLIKHFVLAVRLLANMMAGHLVLAVIVAFIGASASYLAWWGVMPASVLGATALSLLELFVAFLQAYIFTFLSALFIGMAIHEH
jgi:F-type H+-transporting ATPase subunit a